MTRNKKERKSKIECIIEISRTKCKFYIIGVDLFQFKFSIIDLYRAQANKILRACDNSLHKLIN